MPWPIGEQWMDTLRVSHGVRARLRASISGSAFVVDLPLVNGEVTVDGNSAARRSLRATVMADIEDPVVSPLGTEVRAEYGIVNLAGQVEWVPVGTFVITRADEAAPGRVNLTGVDRWQRVLDARLERPVSTSGNTVTAIRDLLEGADSRITVSTTGAPKGTHRTALWERDRSEAILNLARTIGAVVYFDPMGVARIAPAPTLTSAPAWQINSGPNGVKVQTRRGISRDRTYNAAVVIAEPPDKAPFFVTVRDTARGSATRYGGPFGKKARFLRTQLITTVAQAQAAAKAQLSKTIGVARTVTAETLPNPTLDAGDVVSVEVADGVWQRHLVVGFPLPLGLGTTVIDTRSTADEELAGE